MTKKFKFEVLNQPTVTTIQRLEIQENRSLWRQIEILTYLTRSVKVREGLAGDFHEDNLVGDASGEVVIFSFFFVDRLSLLASLDEQERLSLDLLGVRRHGRDVNHVGASRRNEHEVTS